MAMTVPYVASVELDDMTLEQLQCQWSLFCAFHRIDEDGAIEERIGAARAGQRGRYGMDILCWLEAFRRAWEAQTTATEVLTIAQRAQMLVAEHGMWGQHPAHPVSYWRAQVQADHTRLGYWQWVAAALAEKADRA